MQTLSERLVRERPQMIEVIEKQAFAPGAAGRGQSLRMSKRNDVVGAAVHDEETGVVFTGDGDARRCIAWSKAGVPARHVHHCVYKEPRDEPGPLALLLFDERPNNLAERGEAAYGYRTSHTRVVGRELQRDGSSVRRSVRAYLTESILTLFEGIEHAGQVVYVPCTERNSILRG